MLESDYDVIVYGADAVTADERFLKPLLRKCKASGFLHVQTTPRQKEANVKVLAPLLTLQN